MRTVSHQLTDTQQQTTVTTIQSTMSEVEPAIVYTQEEVDKAFEEALDDVHTRFILNLPPEELASTNRIFFQLEQAWWFYDDFICDGSDLPLPSLAGIFKILGGI